MGDAGGKMLEAISTDDVVRWAHRTVSAQVCVCALPAQTLLALQSSYRMAPLSSHKAQSGQQFIPTAREQIAAKWYFFLR